MGTATYILAILLASALVVVPNPLFASDSPNGVLGWPVGAIFNGIAVGAFASAALAPLLLGCVLAGAAWASLMRRVTTSLGVIPPIRPTSRSKARGAFLFVCGTVAAVGWLMIILNLLLRTTSSWAP